MNTLLDLNSKHVKSYATRENLVAAMEKIGATNFRHLIARNDAGRWVAIFVGFEQTLVGSGFAMVG
jgi:hypothetical protein